MPVPSRKFLNAPPMPPHQRARLARDLAHWDRWLSVRLAALPLFEVAVDGKAGMVQAVRLQRRAA